jgi:isopenicillin N synthase-like dioxygenase
VKTETVPTVDIRQLESSQTLAELDYACRDWGFFQITNHGISETMIARLSELMHEFFAQPAAKKREISRSRANPWGFFDRELTKNTPDWKEVYDYGPADGEIIQPQWPHDIPGFRNAVDDYFTACEALSYKLLAALSTNLGMPPDFLARGFEPEHSSFLRLNYYPVCPNPDSPEGLENPDNGHLGVNQHTDAGALTLLLQDDQPGLEIFNHGRWHLVEPRRDALVINIGDIVQVWSNDTYRAALHRAVTNTERARYSIPFFFNPDYRTNYAPVPTMISDDHPAQYKEINWGEFRDQRHAGDYANYGEEVQISHYKTSAG